MFRLTLVALALVGMPAALDGQTGFAASYGRWWHDSAATTFSAELFGPALGPVSWSLGISHLADPRATDNRTQTGGMIGLGLGRDGQGLYGVLSAGLGLRHGTSDIDAAWSVGAGWALRLLGPSLAIEARYRWEDRRLQGFWQLDPADRHGWVVQGRLSFSLGTSAPTPVGIPSGERDRVRRVLGASGNSAALTAAVVRTALDVMGTPYEWGGTDANGFDCSGLIQFAYSRHGIILPRVSRDQMRQGIAVSTRLDALRPGDLLGFSVSGRGISHVGLYVGGGEFIHSASRGVVLTSLTGGDPDSAYWRRRWVAARRIVD